MSHSCLFGLEVESIIGIGFNLNRNTLGDLQAEFLELVDLVRIIGQDAHSLDTELAQNLRTDEVLAFIAGKAQCQIGIKRIQSLLLQFIGAKFVDQTDSAAFLTQAESRV